jgi:hypothetical protein
VDDPQNGSSSNLQTHTGTEFLSAVRSTQIFKDLLTTNSRYRQMVNTFQGLAGLESELTFLQELKTETVQGFATELREAEEASRTHFDSQQGSSVQSGPANAQKASWETLIIPQSLRQNLKAYCRILRDHQGYQAKACICPRACFSTASGMRQKSDRQNPEYRRRPELLGSVHLDGPNFRKMIICLCVVVIPFCLTVSTTHLVRRAIVRK